MKTNYRIWLSIASFVFVCIAFISGVFAWITMGNSSGVSSIGGSVIDREESGFTVHLENIQGDAEIDLLPGKVVGYRLTLTVVQTGNYTISFIPYTSKATIDEVNNRIVSSNGQRSYELYPLYSVNSYFYSDNSVYYAEEEEKLEIFKNIVAQADLQEHVYCYLTDTEVSEEDYYSIPFTELLSEFSAKSITGGTHYLYFYFEPITSITYNGIDSKYEGIYFSGSNMFMLQSIFINLDIQTVS